MSVPQVLLALLAIYLVLVALAWLVVVPFLGRHPGVDPTTGLMQWIVRIYCRVWHRARFSRLEHVRTAARARDGLIVVSNHTGAVDPLVIQSQCPFIIRWLMASEMMIPQLDWFWRRQKVIPVNRDGRDTSALRAAIRHVRHGGCVGIFPEGRIVQPPREIRPFVPGVGALVAKTQAPVLVCWVSGTPDTPIMSEALASRSHARVVYLDVIEFAENDSPETITAALRRRIHEASGWPLNDEPMPPIVRPEE
jgi:1-acyl-sn-glycerol-3-phosphate acyltransferase